MLNLYNFFNTSVGEHPFVHFVDIFPNRGIAPGDRKHSPNRPCVKVVVRQS